MSSLLPAPLSPRLCLFTVPLWYSLLSDCPYLLSHVFFLCLLTSFLLCLLSYILTYLLRWIHISSPCSFHLFLIMSGEWCYVFPSLATVLEHSGVSSTTANLRAHGLFPHKCLSEGQDQREIVVSFLSRGNREKDDRKSSAPVHSKRKEEQEYRAAKWWDPNTAMFKSSTGWALAELHDIFQLLLLMRKNRYRKTDSTWFNFYERKSMKVDAIKIINHIVKQIHIKRLCTLCNETHLLKHDILIFYLEKLQHIHFKTQTKIHLFII